jgi:hypothetical protein
MNLALMALWEAGSIPPPSPPVDKGPKPVVKKGHCKHCGKVIGRGLYRHEKACGVKK